jgi:hypothetical protein
MMDNIFDQVNISPFTQKIDEDCIELIEVYRSASLFSFVCHYFVGISMKEHKIRKSIICLSTSAL